MPVNDKQTTSSLLLEVENKFINNDEKKEDNPFLKFRTSPSTSDTPTAHFAPSELLSRLKSFLPMIKEANEKLGEGTITECVEILENDDEEGDVSSNIKDQSDSENDEEETVHEPYVEMNLVLGVLEEKKKQSLITDLEASADSDKDETLKNEDDNVNLRIGNELTPQETKKVEEDMLAYMNIMNSLLSSSTALKRKREESSDDGSDDSSDNDSDQ